MMRKLEFLTISIVLVVASVDAAMVPGRGDPRTECLVTLNVSSQNQDPPPVRRGSRITQDSCGDTCYFPLALCSNTAMPHCKPAALDSILVIGETGESPLTRPKLSTTANACADPPTTVPVRIRRGRHRAVRRLRLFATTKNGHRVDDDTITLVCERSDRPCCGDGQVTAGEECDYGGRVDGDLGPSGTGPRCDDDCTLTVCGDGHRVDGVEVCEDNNLVDFDGCESDCTNTSPECLAAPAPERCKADADCPLDAVCNGCRCQELHPCTCGPEEHRLPKANLLRFTRTDATPPCGRVTDGAGTSQKELLCGTLYVGDLATQGSDIAVPGTATTTVGATCSGSDVLLSGAAATAVLPSDGCSAPSCLYAAPIPVPGALLTTCLLVSIRGDVSGKLTCNGNDWQVERLLMPLSAEIYRSKTSNAPSDPTQACPRCTGKTRDTCSETDVELIARLELPSLDFITRESPLIARTLRTGFDGQTGVFCGYCRQAEDECFEGDPLCGGNGVSRACKSDADCSMLFPICRQNLGGAFNTSTLAERIQLTGESRGDLSGGEPQPARLVSSFCIPPTYSVVSGTSIDKTSGLPGPGALGFVGTLQLTPPLPGPLP